MNLRSLSLLVLLPTTLLGACSSVPVHESLPVAAREKISSADVFVPIRQNEIYVYVPPSTAGSSAGASAGLLGGLVGAAIDAGVNDVRSSKAETAVKPLRDSLVDFNFDQ